MPKYENGVIYKLKHNEDYDDDNIYIGSTTNFKNRKNDHKTSCNNVNHKCYNCPKYQYIRDNGGWDQWVMIPIEQYSCYNKKELTTRERYHIDILRPALNKAIPNRTKKEYNQDNKEKIAEKAKKYKEANKEQLKEYRYKNKEHINKKCKEHYEANREKILERQKQKRNNDKEKYNQIQRDIYQSNKEQKKEKVICDHCGCEIRKDCLLRHKKTNKCINFVKLLEKKNQSREDKKEYYKKYREVNKELIKEKSKKHYENNKEIINQKVICDHCGSECIKYGLKRHQRTKKCIDFVKKA